MENPEQPDWMKELMSRMPEEWKPHLGSPGGAQRILDGLSEKYSVADLAAADSDTRRLWDLIGAFYRSTNLWYDAAMIYERMYYRLLELQDNTGSRIHKGTQLVWLADCYDSVGNVPLSKRYLMLTLVEDAVTLAGNLDPVSLGSYYRLLWRHGVPDTALRVYASEAYRVSMKQPREAHYPEFILQDLDKNWIVEVPSSNDAAIYVANTVYVRHLMDKLGGRSGKSLERLADYVLSCIPGCRTARRKRSRSTDYDIVCSIEGPDVNFFSEVGRYFVCECKDWAKPADFSAFAKFCRVLDSVKAHFGIIFSREGITGRGRTTDAEREQLKVFQDRGLVIIVVDRQDLQAVADGANFITLLREKYERVRLDLGGSR